jgi:DNA-binding response OmpR family regulator
MATVPRKDAASSPTNQVGNHNTDSSHPEKIVTVLAVSPLEEDHVFLGHIFSHSNWKIHVARSCSEALQLLRERTIPVVLCDSEIPDSTWKDVLAQLGQLSHPPLLIVTSRLADESLWAEVLNLGGYDVLMKPFDRMEVVRVISLAWLHWKHTWERLRGIDNLTPAVAASG